MQRTLIQRWSHALKLAGWPKVLVPAALGQASGMLADDRLGVLGWVVGFFVVAAHTVFILLLNDWADQQVDDIKRRMFPDGCSPKTIPDGILGARVLLIAGVSAGGLLLVGSFFIAAWIERPALGWLALAQLLLFSLYSLPPIRLNYRGGGEVLEAIGIGLLLPITQAYIQSGELWPGSPLLLLIALPLAQASALASGLADERSDVEGGKTTFTTVFGNEAVRSAIAWCWSLAVLMALWMAVVHERTVLYLMPATALIYFGVRMQIESSGAITDAFAAQRRFKSYLHRGSWACLLLFACLTVML